jgi:putative tryptophan/tyrosine transport system substrate-binding protein
MRGTSRNRFFRFGSDNNLKSKIKNRKWAGLFAILVLLVGCVGMAEAQQPPRKVARIGILTGGSSSDPAYRARHEALRQELEKFGYVEGQNIFFEDRFGDGKLDQIPHLAEDLVRRKVDIIVAGGNAAIRAAKQVSGGTIPIVMGNAGDPVEEAFVASLARPGGNITGLSSVSPTLHGKRLELLQEAFPKISHVAVFWDPGNRGNTLYLKDTWEVARALKLQFQAIELRAGAEIENGFRTSLKNGANALMIVSGGLLNAHRPLIVDLSARSRLPAIYTEQDWVPAGGLMAYATNFSDLYRRAALYVDKILKGANPGHLPVEQPTKFELVINLKTAKQIGLTIPQPILYRADKVIK